MNCIIMLVVIILFLYFCEYSESFINVQNTPGINTGGQYPLCPQGFKLTYDNRCIQFCRGCKTGVCRYGYCRHY